MALAPFLFIPARDLSGGYTEFTYTCIGTKVLPRAQGRNALSDRRLQRRGRRPEPVRGHDPCSARADSGEQEAAALLKHNRDDR